jgi:hypothetical protein
MVNNTNYNTTDSWWLAKKIRADGKGLKSRLGEAMVFRIKTVIIHKDRYC